MLEQQDLSVWREYLPNLETLIAFSNRLVQAIIVLFVAQVLIAVLRHLSNRQLNLKRKNADERMSKTFSALVGNLLKYVIYFFAACQILTIFGVSVSSLIAVAGIGSVAIGFGAQSVVKDIITGLLILAEDEFAVSDYITVGGFSGTVEALGIRATRLRSATGELHIIPNSEITTVTNYSKGNMRAMVEVRVPYDAQIDGVFSALREELNAFQSDKIISPPLVQGITALEDQSVLLRVICDCKPGEGWGIERELRLVVKKRLEQEGIPAPQQVIRLAGEEPAR